MTTALWLRGDLRKADHLGWLLLKKGDVAFFSIDPTLSRALNRAKRPWIASALAELDDWLEGQLTTLVCRPGQELAERLHKAGVNTVITHESYSPGIRRRIETTARALGTLGIELRYLDSPYAVAPGSVLTADGHPHRVFSRFFKAWLPEASKVAPAPMAHPPRLANPYRDFNPDQICPATDWPPPPETWTLSKLENFITQQLSGYANTRDYPGLQGSSGLSIPLHFGIIHPRTVLNHLSNNSSAGPFIRQLAWREFYGHLLAANPNMINEELDVNYRQIIWESGPTAAKRFRAWCEGRTGYPIVDAGMRQLITQGWMHNRVRMITASFLVKDLHIDWRTGAQFFEDHLADGDIASNRGNWQWVAGTGTDAAPYFRIFNPIRQAKLFDPQGQYVKQFVPELRGVPDRYIHEPWLWNGFSGIDYPEPIVDHFAERKRCLEYYRRGS